VKTHPTTRRTALALAALLGLWLVTGCGPTTPEGIDPIRGFDVQRYMGRWYEIARLDHRFERGMEQVTAHYALQTDGTVEVVNRGFATAEGKWREARGKARFVDSPDVGALEVSFFGPFYGGYNIVDLDPAYQLALVAGPNRSYVWILSRTPQPPREEVERLVALAAGLGFDTQSLIYVRH
jgi:apolipoprotein D and lipocalin family protein